MIWINGPNFLAMKEQGLLHGPFVADLPNARFWTCRRRRRTWSISPCRSMAWKALAAGAVRVQPRYRPRADPAPQHGRVCRLGGGQSGAVHPPGSIELHGRHLPETGADRTGARCGGIAAPATDAAFDAATAPLWAWYDALRPNLWRGGTAFPENQSVQQQLLNDGEIDIAMSFDPASTAAALPKGCCPTACGFSCRRPAASAMSALSPSPSTPRTRKARWWWRTSFWTRRRRRTCRISRCWVVLGAGPGAAG
jgi:putative thiamine transport system substrate-binding protein